METRTNEFICQICFNPFNDSENLPKILPCGHTICKICLCSLLKTNKYCPLCRRSFRDSEQATNFSLLNLCHSFSKTPTTFKDDLFHIYIKKISKSLENIQKDLQNAVKDATALDSLRSQNDMFVQQMDEVRIAFSDIKLSVQTLESGLFFTHRTPVVNINIKNYTSSEIAARLMKGEKMFAVACINDDMKYGKVHCRGDWIFINAMTLTEIDIDSSVFWLYDFKKHFKEELCPFLTFSYDSEESFTKIVQFADYVDSSDLLDLCTGEPGSSFKDCPYFWKDKLTLSIYVLANKGMTFYFEKKMKSFYDRIATTFEVISPLSWEFTSTKGRSMDSKIVGKFFGDLKFPFLFPKEARPRVITECGIAVHVR